MGGSKKTNSSYKQKVGFVPDFTRYHSSSTFMWSMRSKPLPFPLAIVSQAYRYVDTEQAAFRCMNALHSSAGIWRMTFNFSDRHLSSLHSHSISRNAGILQLCNSPYISFLWYKPRYLLFLALELLRFYHTILALAVYNRLHPYLLHSASSLVHPSLLP
jgi:hypothetical protein